MTENIPMDNYLSWNEDNSNSSKDKNKFNNNQWGNNDNKKGPPDLDEFFRGIKKSVTNFINQLLGKKKISGSPFGSNGLNKNGLQPNQAMFGLFALVFFMLIVILGFYKVDPGEKAVEYRFGKYVGMKGPGPHWLLPLIYSKEIVNTSIMHQEKFEDDLITKEVNIVTLSLAVTYNISNLEDYLFKVQSPKDSLAEATRAAIRQVVSQSTLEQVLSTRGNTEANFLGDQIKTLIEQSLKYYQAGLNVQGVEILSVLPPQQVKEAFNDAIQAQEDEIRYQNEAEAYERKIFPVAEGNAARIIQDANTYVAQKVLAAEGDTARFNAILPEYAKAPGVTRSRMYIDTMESVLKNTPKILVDNKSSNVLYLPLDKMNFNNVIAGAIRNKNSFKQQNQSLIDDADISMRSTTSNEKAENQNSNNDQPVNNTNSNQSARFYERINRSIKTQANSNISRTDRNSER